MTPEFQQGLSVANHEKLQVLDQVLDEARSARNICLQEQWKFRPVADKPLGWVEKFIAIGNVVVSYDPTHAALPWAGVRFLVQASRSVYCSMGYVLTGLKIAIGDKNKMEEVLNALEDIGKLIGMCAIYEILYLGKQTTAARCETVIVDLYAAILLYLFHAKQYYDRNTTGTWCDYQMIPQLLIP